jgi:sterol desaturase/sphingolipid hydroxylase (fatty acid hydroxylase superfamily)
MNVFVIGNEANIRIGFFLGVFLVMAVLLLDLTIYAQHVFFHKIPVFWRLHRMHHTDLDIDVTTGARFHPVEIGLSMGIKMVTVAVLGAPPGRSSPLKYC